MFEELKGCIYKLECLVENGLDDENEEFSNNMELYFAKAIKNELPNPDRIADIIKIIC